MTEEKMVYKCEGGPMFISFDVTSLCNLECLHCFNNSSAVAGDDLTDAEALSVAQQIAEFSPVTICICGGEPMLRKNLFSIIECVSKTAANVSMVCNGYYIDECNAQQLKQAGLKVLQISLDGINSIQHDTLRGKAGSFDKAVEAIKIGVNVGLQVYVSLVPSKLNYRTISQFIEMCYSLGVLSTRIMPLIPMGRGSNMEKLLLSSEEYIELQLAIQNEKEKYNNIPYLIEWGDPLDHYTRMQNNAKLGSNNLSAEIKSNGNITVSTYIPVVVGNIRKHSLKEYWDAGYKDIWKNEKFVNYISSIQTIYDLNCLNPRPYSGEYLYIDLID